MTEKHVRMVVDKSFVLVRVRVGVSTRIEKFLTLKVDLDFVDFA